MLGIIRLIWKVQHECIPVGCVPPAAVAVGGRGLYQGPLLRSRHPPDQTPMSQAPPPPGSRHPPRPDPPEQAPPLVDRHTPVNILPCPKLRLRAVKSRFDPAFCLQKELLQCPQTFWMVDLLCCLIELVSVVNIISGRTVRTIYWRFNFEALSFIRYQSGTSI